MENALRLYRPTLRAQSVSFFLIEWWRRSLNFWTLQPCLLSSNWSACKHLFLDKLLILRGLARGWKLYHSNMKRLLDFAPWKGIWFRESRKISLLESGILGCGIRNSTQEIWNATSDWNPESKFDWQIVDSSTKNPESTAWNLKSKTVLDSRGDQFRVFLEYAKLEQAKERLWL